MEWWLD